MRIASLRVAGFRSLRGAEIPIAPMTAFIGPNGSGKSSALVALRLFFFPQEAVGEDDFWRGSDGTKADEIAIAVTFAELSDAEKESFSPYVSAEGDLTIERVFSQLGRGTYLASRMGIREFADIRRLPKGHRDQYNELAASGRFAGLEAARNKDEALESMTAWETNNSDKCEEISDEIEFLLRPAGEPTAISSYLHAVFVGALEDPGSHVEARGGGSMFGLLESAADFKQVESELRLIADQAGQQVAEVLAGRGEVFDRSKEAVDRALTNFAPGFVVDLAWGTPRPLQPNLPQVVVSVQGLDGLATDMAHQGHGVQRSLMFGVLTAQAELNVGEMSRRIGVFIEEPEAFQHPLSARALSRTFARLTTGSYQIVYSTHSPELVSSSEISGLRFFSRGPSAGGGGFHTSVQAFSIERMAASLESAVDGQDFTAESTVARVEANVDSSVLVGLFARLAVLVEGDEDDALLRGAAAAHGWDLDESGVAVVRCRGKTNIPLILAFFKEAGVSTYSVFDLDRNKKEKDWRGAVWAEEAVRRLVGLTEMVELSETEVGKEFTSWREDFGHVVRGELGGAYDAHEQRVCLELGYRVKQGRKVGPVVQKVLEGCYSHGHRSSSLDQLVDVLRARLG